MWLCLKMWQKMSPLFFFTLGSSCLFPHAAPVLPSPPSGCPSLVPRRLSPPPGCLRPLFPHGLPPPPASPFCTSEDHPVPSRNRGGTRGQPARPPAGADMGAAQRGAPVPQDWSKDVIISGGENVSSGEVESVLYGHPAVNEVVVVAQPDEFWGETPCTFISKREGVEEHLAETKVISWCWERMPHYMVLKTVVVKLELPKTSTGKIQKYVLRDMAKAMGSPRSSRM